MTVFTEVLCKLHRIHRSIADLNERLERGPRQLRSAQGQLAEREKQLVVAKEALMQTRMKADAKQLQLKTREDHIKSVQGKLNTCSTNKEFQALKDQITADEKANLVQQDEILEVLEKMDERESDIASIQAGIAEAKKLVEEVTARVAAEKGLLEADLARVQEERTEVEKVLPGDFKKDYERAVRGKGEDALAQVENSTCTGCYTTITTNQLNNLMLNKPLFCANCGALLYLPEDRTVT